MQRDAMTVQRMCGGDVMIIGEAVLGSHTLAPPGGLGPVPERCQPTTPVLACSPSPGMCFGVRAALLPSREQASVEEGTHPPPPPHALK